MVILLLAVLFTEDHLDRCAAEHTFPFRRVGKRLRCELTDDQAVELYSDAEHYASWSGVDRADNAALCSSAKAVQKAIEKQAPHIPALLTFRLQAAAVAARELRARQEADPVWQAAEAERKEIARQEGIQRAIERLSLTTAQYVSTWEFQLRGREGRWTNRMYSYPGTLVLGQGAERITIDCGDDPVAAHPEVVGLRRKLDSAFIEWHEVTP